MLQSGEAQKCLLEDRYLLLFISYPSPISVTRERERAVCGGPEREGIVIEFMASDCKAKASRRGLEIKELRDMKDLTIHDVQYVSDELTTQKPPRGSVTNHPQVDPVSHPRRLMNY